MVVVGRLIFRKKGGLGRKCSPGKRVTGSGGAMSEVGRGKLGAAVLGLGENRKRSLQTVKWRKGISSSEVRKREEDSF